MSLGRPLLYNRKLVHVTVSLDGDVYMQYRDLQERRGSNASVGIREYIQREVMENQNEKRAQELLSIIPSY